MTSHPPEGKGNHQRDLVYGICKTSIPGSNPGGPPNFLGNLETDFQAGTAIGLHSARYCAHFAAARLRRGKPITVGRVASAFRTFGRVASAFRTFRCVASAFRRKAGRLQGR